MWAWSCLVSLGRGGWLLHLFVVEHIGKGVSTGETKIPQVTTFLGKVVGKQLTRSKDSVKLQVEVVDYTTLTESF